jgi:hypothetical protein
MKELGYAVHRWRTTLAIVHDISYPARILLLDRRIRETERGERRAGWRPFFDQVSETGDWVEPWMLATANPAQVRQSPAGITGTVIGDDVGDADRTGAG